jgi:hypothetical protein
MEENSKGSWHNWELSREKQIDDAKRGDLYNTVSGQIYKGKDGVSLVPCAYQRRFIQWAPRGSGTGAPIAIFDTEGDCPKVERSKDDNKDYVVGGDGSYIEETHQHFVLIVDEDGSAETALIAMKSTALKKSRKWNSMIASATVQGKNGPFTPPRYGFVYRAKTVMEENSKGSWHNWELSREKQIDDAKMLWSNTRTKRQETLRTTFLFNVTGGASRPPFLR